VPNPLAIICKVISPTSRLRDSISEMCPRFMSRLTAMSIWVHFLAFLSALIRLPSRSRRACFSLDMPSSCRYDQSSRVWHTRHFRENKMKNPFLIMACAICAVVLFGSGLLVGRQFPAHHFEKLPQSTYLLDSSSGHICDLLALKALSPDSSQLSTSNQGTSANEFLAVMDDKKQVLSFANEVNSSFRKELLCPTSI